jgi:pimeloyl-ACP methyl ester carboxylesterase
MKSSNKGLVMQTTSSLVTSNGITLHIERTGGDKPALIMYHGVTDNGRCMLRLAEQLSIKYDVILVDARGHGLSESPESGYSADYHADDLAGLIESLTIWKPILYGHSMGARTVSRVAAKYPELPKAIILEDPVNILPSSPQEIANRDVWLKGMIEDVKRWKTMPFETHLENAKQQGFQDWTEDEQIEWAKSKPQVSLHVFEIGMSMQSILDDFPNIKCPTLILKADADDDTKLKNEGSAKLIPNCKIIHVPGAGHNIRRDDFAATLRYIQDFLATL